MKTAKNVDDLLSPFKKVNKVVVRERLSGNRVLWTWETVRSALLAQKRGDFTLITQLAADMMCDEDYSAAIDKRVSGLIRSELLIEPCDPLSDLDTAVAELTQALIWDMLPETELSRLDELYLHTDIALGKLNITVKDGLYLPVLETLSPEFVRYYSNADATYEWRYSNYDGQQLTIAPGDGLWVMVDAWKMGWPGGLVSRLAELVAAKKFGFRSYVDFLDNSGYPITKGTTPIDAPDDAKQEFAEELAMAQQAKVVITPQSIETGKGYDVQQLAGAGSTSDGSFSNFLDYCGRKVKVSVNGGNLSSEMASGGSYAAAEVHLGNERDLVQKDAQVLSTVIREQILRPFVHYNFGPGVGVPHIRWKLEPSVDVEAQGSSLNSFADFVAKMSASGMQVQNIAEIAKTFGVELAVK